MSAPTNNVIDHFDPEKLRLRQTSTSRLVSGNCF